MCVEPYCSTFLGGEYAESDMDTEINVLRSEVTNCMTQMETLRREFTQLRDELTAARRLMDSMREMVLKLLSVQ